jgi:hypothetical protein
MMHSFFSRLSLLALFTIAPLQARDRVLHEIVGPVLTQYSEEKNNIALTVKQLNINNTDLFSKKRIFKKYQPLEITVHNKGSQAVYLTQDSLDLPLERPKKISRMFQHNPFFAIFWPWSSITPTKIYAMMFFGIFGIIGTTVHDNKRIKQQFASYATDLQSTIYIPAHGSVTRCVYVHKRDYEPHFTFAVFSDTTHETLFNIKLGPILLI